MTLQQAIKTLELHQEYRKGILDEMPFPPREITEALNIVLNEVKQPCIHPYFSVIGEEHGNPYCLQCETKLY